jgi:hypothetical protein
VHGLEYGQKPVTTVQSYDRNEQRLLAMGGVGMRSESLGRISRLVAPKEFWIGQPDRKLRLITTNDG